MKLHNLCIDKNVPMPGMRFHEDFARNDEWVVVPNEHDDDHNLRGRPIGDRRRLITDDFERRGVLDHRTQMQIVEHRFFLIHVN